MEYVILVLLGFLAGTIGSLVGLGGGIIIVPALVMLGSWALIPEVSPQIAAGTSLVVVIFNGISSTMSYMKSKTIDYRSAIIFSISATVGGLIGVWANGFLNGKSFNTYFGIFMICMSFLLLFKDKLSIGNRGNKKITRTFTDNDGVVHTYGYNILPAVIIPFIVGFFGGLFGIGGGSLMVPAMVILFSFPPHVAVATSMLIVFLSAIGSVTMQIINDHVSWIFSAFLVPGVWFGAKLGSWTNKRIKGKTLMTLLRVVLILLGIRLLYQGLM